MAGLRRPGRIAVQMAEGAAWPSEAPRACHRRTQPQSRIAQLVSVSGLGNCAQPRSAKDQARRSRFAQVGISPVRRAHRQPPLAPEPAAGVGQTAAAGEPPLRERYVWNGRAKDRYAIDVEGVLGVTPGDRHIPVHRVLRVDQLVAGPLLADGPACMAGTRARTRGQG